MRPLAAVPAGLVAVLAATLLVACGGGSKDEQEVPDGAVAVVDATEVPRDRFDRFVTSRARGITPLGGSAEGAAIPLDPPGFTGCVAALTEQAETSGSTAAPPSADQLRGTCQAQHAGVQQAVAQSLLTGTWALEQARADKLRIDPQTVTRTLEQYVASAGARDGREGSADEARRQFDRILERSGLTTDDLRWQLSAQLAQQLLLAERAAKLPQPTVAEARAYVRENPGRFGGAAVRRLEVVVTDDEAQARRAAARLRDGEGIGAVTEDVTVDPALVEAGGVLRVTQGSGQLPPAVEEAAFDDELGVGDVSKPVEAGGRFYVVRVASAKRARTPSFTDVREEAIAQVRAERVQAEQRKLDAELRERWRPETTCVKPAIVPECSNGPDRP